MTEMMRECWQWMMSLGMLGMLMGFVLLAALIVLVIALIRWAWRQGGTRP